MKPCAQVYSPGVGPCGCLTPNTDSLDRSQIIVLERLLSELEVDLGKFGQTFDKAQVSEVRGWEETLGLWMYMKQTATLQCKALRGRSVHSISATPT